MPKITFKKQFNQINDAVDREIKKASLAFHGNIVKAWPVDTGYSVSSWEVPEKINGGYMIKNPVSYSPVLWLGLHDVNGVTYGSAQMPFGGAPILNSTINTLVARVKYLK